MLTKGFVHSLWKKLDKNSPVSLWYAFSLRSSFSAAFSVENNSTQWQLWNREQRVLCEPTHHQRVISKNSTNWTANFTLMEQNTVCDEKPTLAINVASGWNRTWGEFSCLTNPNGQWTLCNILSPTPLRVHAAPAFSKKNKQWGWRHSTIIRLSPAGEVAFDG